MKQVTITPINVGHLRFNLSDIYKLPHGHPYAGQHADVPMVSYHIALPGRSLLVDAVDYDPEEISTDLLVPDYQPPPSLLEQLSARSIDAAQVTDVIITHAHFDHFGALTADQEGKPAPAFPRARHYLSKADWQPHNFDDLEERTLSVVQQQDLLQLVEGELDIGDGMCILPMPGETPGHQILCLQREDGERYFAGDLYHHAAEFIDPALDVYWAAPQAMRRSKESFIKRASANNGAAYFTHIAGAYRPVKQDDETFVWQSAAVE